jgi:ketosteroid isomerase-like protein
MKTLKQVVIFVAGCLLMVSCNKPSEPVSTFDLEKVKTAITEANQKFMDAMGRGDSLAITSCYHSEGMIMAPNMEPITGKDKIASFNAGGIKMGITGIVVKTTEVGGSEESVYEVGTYELLGKDKVAIDKGKYLAVWKQDNGEWKLYRDMFSSNLPLPAPPSK